MSQLQRWPVMWGIIYVVLLLLTVTPFGIFTINLLMVPVILLYVKQDRKSFVISYGIILAVAYLVCSVIGSTAAGTVVVIISLFFLLPSVAMGHYYQLKSAARTVMGAGIVTMLVQMLLLIMGLALYGINVASELESFMRSWFQTLPEALLPMFPEEMRTDIIDMIIRLIPTYLLAISFYYVILNHWISRKILNRFGEELPGMPPMREWMLPKSFVWIYLGAILFSLITGNSESVIYTLLINLIPILVFTFSIQAIAFLFYICHLKGWSSIWPIAALILMILLSPLQNLLSLLGVFDVAFPLRDKLKNNRPS